MKAVVFDKIGSPLDVLRLAPVPIPEIADNEVLVKMISASINPIGSMTAYTDWRSVRLFRLTEK